MSRKTLLFASAAVFSMLATRSLAQSPEQAVAQAVEKLRVLMIDPEKAALDALLEDKLSYGHSSGKLEDKTAFVTAYVSGAYDFKTIDLTEQTITVVDNTAMVRHKLAGETNDGGKPGQARLSVLQIWVKQKNAWKLLARQAVKI